MSRPADDNNRLPRSGPDLLYVEVTSVHNEVRDVIGASNATPIVIQTDGAHGFTTGDLVRVWEVGGNTAANGEFIITVLDSDHFSLNDSAGNAAYTTGGKAELAQPVLVKCLKWKRIPAVGDPPDYETYGGEFPIDSIKAGDDLSVGDRLFIGWRPDSRRWEPMGGGGGGGGGDSTLNLGVATSGNISGSTSDDPADWGDGFFESIAWDGTHAAEAAIKNRLPSTVDEGAYFWWMYSPIDGTTPVVVMADCP